MNSCETWCVFTRRSELRFFGFPIASLAFGWRFYGAVTDMLIFFLNLSLFVFKSTDCAFADDSREAETGTGRVGCVFDSFNFFQNLFSPSPFSFGARDERDRGRGRSSICGGAIDLDGARARAVSRGLYRGRDLLVLFFRLARILSLSLSPIAR